MQDGSSSLRHSADASRIRDDRQSIGIPRRVGALSQSTWDAPASPLCTVAMSRGLLERLDGLLLDMERDVVEDLELCEAESLPMSSNGSPNFHLGSTIKLVERRRHAAELHVAQLAELRKIVANGRFGFGWTPGEKQEETYDELHTLRRELDARKRDHDELVKKHASDIAVLKKRMLILGKEAKAAKAEEVAALAEESVISVRHHSHEAEVLHEQEEWRRRLSKAERERDWESQAARLQTKERSLQSHTARSAATRLRELEHEFHDRVAHVRLEVDEARIHEVLHHAQRADLECTLAVTLQMELVELQEAEAKDRHHREVDHRARDAQIAELQQQVVAHDRLRSSTADELQAVATELRDSEERSAKHAAESGDLVGELRDTVLLELSKAEVGQQERLAERERIHNLERELSASRHTEGLLHATAARCVTLFSDPVHPSEHDLPSPHNLESRLGFLEEEVASLKNAEHRCKLLQEELDSTRVFANEAALREHARLDKDELRIESLEQQFASTHEDNERKLAQHLRSHRASVLDYESQLLLAKNTQEFHSKQNEEKRKTIINLEQETETSEHREKAHQRRGETLSNKILNLEQELQAATVKLEKQAKVSFSAQAQASEENQIVSNAHKQSAQEAAAYRLRILDLERELAMNSIPPPPSATLQQRVRDELTLREEKALRDEQVLREELASRDEVAIQNELSHRSRVVVLEADLEKARSESLNFSACKQQLTELKAAMDHRFDNRRSIGLQTEDPDIEWLMEFHKKASDASGASSSGGTAEATPTRAVLEQRLSVLENEAGQLNLEHTQAKEANKRYVATLREELNQHFWDSSAYQKQTTRFQQELEDSEANIGQLHKETAALKDASNIQSTELVELRLELHNSREAAQVHYEQNQLHEKQAAELKQARDESERAASSLQEEVHDLRTLPSSSSNFKQHYQRHRQSYTGSNREAEKMPSLTVQRHSAPNIGELLAVPVTGPAKRQELQMSSAGAKVVGSSDISKMPPLMSTPTGKRRVSASPMSSIADAPLERSVEQPGLANQVAPQERSTISSVTRSIDVEEESADSQSSESTPDEYLAMIEQVEKNGWHNMDWQNRGYTLLHWAAKHDKANVCKKLLLLRADPSQQDEDGKSPLDYANDNSSQRALDALKMGRHASHASGNSATGGNVSANPAIISESSSRPAILREDHEDSQSEESESETAASASQPDEEEGTESSETVDDDANWV